MEARRTRALFVFTEGEPLLREMEEEGQMPPPGMQLVRIPAAGHTFRPQWAQKLVGGWIDNILASVSEISAHQVKQ